MLAPTALFEAPAATKTAPDAPPTAVPVFTFKSPERPAFDEPDWISTAPLLGDAEVKISTLPLALVSDAPLAMLTKPPFC